MEVVSRSTQEEVDEESLKWAAIQRLPTERRIRRGILTEEDEEAKEVDIKSLGLQQLKNLLERLVKNGQEEDNEKFLLKLRTALIGTYTSSRGINIWVIRGLHCTSKKQMCITLHTFV